jgi:hypothetical protein
LIEALRRRAFKPFGLPVTMFPMLGNGIVQYLTGGLECRGESLARSRGRGIARFQASMPEAQRLLE